MALEVVEDTINKPPVYIEEAKSCPRDTDGDGDCGNKWCPDCGGDGSLTTVIYRASALSMDLHVLAAARAGLDPLPVPDSQQRRFDDGHLHEGAVLAEMERVGWKLWDKQKTVEIQVKKGVKIRGHIDALGRQNASPVPYLIDIKSMSAGSYKKWVEKRWDCGGYILGYARQFLIYGTALKVNNCLLVAKNKDNGELDFFYFDLTVDHPFSISSVKAKVLKVESAHKSGVDLTIPKAKCESYPCPYFYLHDEGEAPDFDDSPELEQAIAEYIEGKAMEEAGKKAKEDARLKLLELAPKGKTITTSLGDVTHAEVKGKRTFQTKDFDRDHPGMREPYFAPGKPYSTITVKEKEQ